MSKNKTIESVKDELETLSVDMMNIIGCLETLENSLYFAEERKDKDMTKPCAKCVELIVMMANNCLNAAMNISDELETVAGHKEA